MTTPGSYHTPAGWAERATYRDLRAPHQIIIANDHRRQTLGELVVTCNCRRRQTPIATIQTAEQALRYWQEAHEPSEVA